MAMSKVDSLRTTASVVAGIATGGILGTVASLVTSKKASFQTKVLMLGAAAAGTGLILIGASTFGSTLFLAGWLKYAMYGTVVSWAIAPSNVAQGALQDMRGKATRQRYLTK